MNGVCTAYGNIAVFMSNVLTVTNCSCLLCYAHQECKDRPYLQLCTGAVKRRYAAVCSQHAATASNVGTVPVPRRQKWCIQQEPLPVGQHYYDMGNTRLLDPRVTAVLDT